MSRKTGKNINVGVSDEAFRRLTMARTYMMLGRPDLGYITWDDVIEWLCMSSPVEELLMSVLQPAQQGDSDREPEPIEPEPTGTPAPADGATTAKADPAPSRRPGRPRRTGNAGVGQGSNDVPQQP